MSEDELGMDYNMLMLFFMYMFMDEDKREELLKSINEYEEGTKNNEGGDNSG